MPVATRDIVTGTKINNRNNDGKYTLPKKRTIDSSNPRPEEMSRERIVHFKVFTRERINLGSLDNSM
jgi:hypothetical protein